MCLLPGTPTTHVFSNRLKACGEQASFRVETQGRCDDCVTLRPRYL